MKITDMTIGCDNSECPCCGYPFDETEAKYGGWIDINNKKPEYGDPVIIVIGSTVQHVLG